MYVLIQQGVSLVIGLQSPGSWLQWPMQLLSVLGNENFFFSGLTVSVLERGCGSGIAYRLPSGDQQLSEFHCQNVICGATSLLGQCKVGWLIGYMIPIVFLRIWEPVASWLKTKTLFQKEPFAMGSD